MMWKEKYKIGVPLIDNQHEELFKRVSEFIQTVRGEGNWQAKLDKVKENMAFMQEYVVVHFNAEEAYQKKINYPDLENHQKIHAKFKADVNRYVQRLEQEGYSEELVQEFGGKLMAWLIMHVAAMDQKIGEYVEGQGGEK
ncbi:bacteriohemerythrin [Desulfotomaculum sp. 1211_IL3151]|uniref:bacteriohemerythrin n=1 Tax=Desulfotomaculum sp. 1211_IL3151 TaxID=3084055 RepID=UPI002FD9FA83